MVLQLQIWDGEFVTLTFENNEEPFELRYELFKALMPKPTHKP